MSLANVTPSLVTLVEGEPSSNSLGSTITITTEQTNTLFKLLIPVIPGRIPADVSGQDTEHFTSLSVSPISPPSSIESLSVFARLPPPPHPPPSFYFSLFLLCFSSSGSPSASTHTNLTCTLPQAPSLRLHIYRNSSSRFQHTLQHLLYAAVVSSLSMIHAKKKNSFL